MSPSQQTPPEGVITTNAFLDALKEIRGGETLAELHHAINALVGAVRSVGKTGTLTLKLNVALAQGSTATVVVTDDLTVKEPKPDREITILFADEANRLSRRDPRQPKLPPMDEARPATARPAADVREFPKAAESAQ